MEELKIALFGVGGFAANYLHVMKQPKREKLRLVCARCMAAPRNCTGSTDRIS